MRLAIEQMALPGISPRADNDPLPLTAPAWVLPTLREMVAATVPAANPIWLVKLAEGGFDDGPLMQAIIAGWLLGQGKFA